MSFKKFKLIMLILFLSTFISGAEQKILFVTHQKTRVYQYPSAFSKQITRLPYGVILNVQEMTSSWVKIIIPEKNINGYIHVDALIDRDTFLRQEKSIEKRETKLLTRGKKGFSEENVVASGTKGFSENDELTAGTKGLSEDNEITAGTKGLSEQDEITAGLKGLTEEDEITAAVKGLNNKSQIKTAIYKLENENKKINGIKRFSEKDEIGSGTKSLSIEEQARSKKDFNDDIEKEYKKVHQGYRYDLVDQIEINGDISDRGNLYQKWRSEGKLGEFCRGYKSPNEGGKDEN